MSEVYYEDYTWYIKLEHYIYGDTKYFEVDVKVEEISSIESVFEEMEHRIPEGYIISDKENLYTLNDLPCEYWAKSYNPGCFESESESESWWEDSPRNLGMNYFDSMIQNF